MIAWITLLACTAAGPAVPDAPPTSVPTAPTALAHHTEVSADELRATLGAATLLDVRPQVPFDAGHVPGAINVPIDELDPMNSEFAALPKDQVVYVIDSDGTIAGKAAATLTAAGYTVITVTGGTDAWVAAGQPVVPTATSQ